MLPTRRDLLLWIASMVFSDRIIRKLGNTGDGGGPGVTPSFWYTHELTIAQGTAWGNSESTRGGAPTMETNGYSASLVNGAAATVNSLATAFGHTWPITLARDFNRTLLTSPIDLNRRMVRLRCIERQLSVSPATCGMMFGLCDNADVLLASNLIGVGSVNQGTTLRKTCGVKRIAGVEVFTLGTTGQAGVAGTEVTVLPSGATSVASSMFIPLDTGFDHSAFGSNSFSHTANQIDLRAMTHIFMAAFYSAQGAVTPTIRYDGVLEILPDLQVE